MHVWRRKIVCFAILVTLASAGITQVAWAQTASWHEIQVFSAIDRQVAAVGESVVLTLEVLITASEDDVALVEQQFAEIQLPLPAGDLALVRSLRPTLTQSDVSLDRPGARSAPARVNHFRRKFVLRPLRSGVIYVPGFEVYLAGRVSETAPHELHVYQMNPSFADAQRSTVPLIVESRLDKRRLRRFIGNGTAFLVAEDALVTSYHVVVNATRIYATLPNGNRIRIRRFWSVDPVRDIAILHVDPKVVRDARMKPIPIAPRDFYGDAIPYRVEREVVFTAGWPDGVQRSGAGVLFAERQFYDDDAIWLSSNRVRPGDSGGPLLNEKGQVVGVISYAMSGGRSSSQLLENVATSTDPRPALAMKLLMHKPVGTGRFRSDSYYERNPYALATKVTTLLAESIRMRGPRDHDVIDPFLRDLDRAASAAFEAPRLHFLQGSIYQMLGNYGEASDAYRKALAARSEHFPAAYSLAYCHLALQSYDVAAGLFEYAVQFAPYQNLARYGLAQAEMRRIRYDTAIKHLKEIIHDHANFAPGLYLLGRAYIGTGNDVLAAQVVAKLRSQSLPWSSLLERSMKLAPFRPVQHAEMPRAHIRTIN